MEKFTDVSDFFWGHKPLVNAKQFTELLHYFFRICGLQLKRKVSAFTFEQLATTD